MPDWQQRRILIWGKTRPELSKSYREIVCTGGVFEDTRRLVRLYPVPLRYMDDERVFKKYQWIEGKVARSSSDPRPESYKIRPDGIVVLKKIPSRSGNWDARAEWIMQPENIFQSVEALKECQKKEHTSLGLIKPATVLDIRADKVNAQEKAEFTVRYEDRVRQMDLPLDPGTGRKIQPLRAADYRFRIRFRCDDSRCANVHNFSVLDWEMDALYFGLRIKKDSPAVAAKKVTDKLRQVCAPDKDLYFFLGNISTHPQVFTIVGLWWPKKKKPLPLFGES